MPEMEDANTAQNFLRHCTDVQRAEYMAFTGPGCTTRKKEFRTLCETSRLKNGKASRQDTKSNTQTEQRVGVYRNDWVIAEKEGGLMDRDTGMRVATAICTAAEKRGPPALMYDRSGKL